MRTPKRARRQDVLLMFFLLSAAPKDMLLGQAGFEYEKEILAWRQRQQNDMQAEDGWLTVVGLFWLKEGNNRVGSNAQFEIALPSSAPAEAGIIEFHAGKTVFRAASGVRAVCRGKEITRLEMQPDTTGNPDIVAIGDLTLQVLKRGRRYGIRLKDKNSAMRRDFTGLRWYPVNEVWRIEASFIPHPAPEIGRASCRERV